MRVIGTLAVGLAIAAIFLPFGVDMVTLICAIMAAIAFRDQPIYSAVAFGINFSNTAVHVPGFVYPAEEFLRQGVVLGPSNEVSWAFLAIQVAFMYAGFYYVLTRGTPVVDRNERQEFAPAE